MAPPIRKIDISKNCIPEYGAPAGTRGISLFIVPKIWVNEDGSLGGPNDVACTGVEHKLGLHDCPTCSLTLGGKGQCRGFLLGNENQGMKIMFHMMNEARLDVGAQGFSHASAAYLYALDYARQRLQGKDISGGKDAQDQAPIIRHPDVRRMLIMMKAYVEGMRSFVYYVARCFDRKAVSGNPEEQARWSAMTELLTPVVKAYCSERGFDVCTQAVQVFGGYGYTQEYPVEQLLRDCKITSIYEGANGIQALDLVGRKLTLKNGAVFNDLIQEMRSTIQLARSRKGLESLSAEFETAMNGLVEIAGILVQKLGLKDVLVALAFSHPFMEIMGDVIMAWMLLWRGSAAQPKLESIAGGPYLHQISSAVQIDRNAAFYDGQVKTAEWFIQTILPVTMGKIQSVKAGCDAAVTIDEKPFGGM